MPSFDQLAQDFASQIASASNKTWAANQVIRQIEELIYTTTRQPLSSADKLFICKQIYHYLPGYNIAIKSADNQNYLQLVNYMLQQLGANEE